MRSRDRIRFAVRQAQAFGGIERFDGRFVIAVVECLDRRLDLAGRLARPGGQGRRGKHQHEDRGHGGSSVDRKTATCRQPGRCGAGKHQFDDQQRDAQGKGHLELLVIAFSRPLQRLLAVCELVPVGIVDLPQIVGPRAGGQVDAVGGRGDPTQQILIGLGEVLLAVGEREEGGFSRGVADGDARALLRITQADGQNRDALFGGLSGGVLGVRLLIVAVGNQDQHLIAVGGRRHYLQRLADGAADVRAAAGYAVRVRRVEFHAEIAEVGRQRRLDRRLPANTISPTWSPARRSEEIAHV